MRAKHLFVLINIRNKVNVVPSNMFKPSSNFLTDHSKAVLLLWILIVICASCHTILSVHCSLMVTCWKRADLLGPCMCFCHFPIWFSGSGVVLVVWIPDLLPYFYKNIQHKWVNISRSAFVNTVTVCLMF